MFKTILATLETPLYCNESVVVGGQLAQHYHSDLFVIHVLQSGYSIYRNYVTHFQTGQEIIAGDDYIAEVKREIERNCSKVLHSCPNCEILVTTGLPWEEILRCRRKINADLILMKPYSEQIPGKSEKRKSMGSTVDEVIRHEPCPVMIVNQPLSKKQLKLKNILTCIDFSESCESAVKFVSGIVPECHSKIFLFHVHPLSKEPTETDYQMLQGFCQKMPKSVETECVLAEGNFPYIEILKCARETDIDLVVMGSHTKRSGPQWFIGSVVERVCDHAFFPVVVVSDPKSIKKEKAV
jgi:nucleotide-binding universal stress UspA family protein